ncbi:MAG: hypothetical protein LBJ67_03370 [Planctomycetaceae bacterium]|nr:hypothetical protein [Planctomycetaceae bacterium]
MVEIETERKPAIENVPMLKHKYWISKKQGYSIIKAVFNNIDTVELSWEKKNKTWVPVAFKLSSTQPYSAEWKIDWASVNEKVPDPYFDLNSLSEKQIPIFSDELGTSIQVGKLGKGVESVADQPKAKYFYFNYILITAGIIMILIGLAKMGYDRWVRSFQT